MGLEEVGFIIMCAMGVVCVCSLVDELFRFIISYNEWVIEQDWSDEDDNVIEFSTIEREK